MDTPLITFEPMGFDWFGTIGISLILALVSLGVFAYFLRLPKRVDNRAKRQLGSTFALLVALLSLGAAYFSWFTGGRNVPIVVYPDRLDGPSGEVLKKDINRIQFVGEKTTSLLTGKEARGEGMIMIEIRGGRRFLIAEKSYDTQTIYPYLQEWRNGKRNKEK